MQSVRKSKKDSSARSHQSLLKLLASFRGARVCIVGDVMLDVFSYGTSTRLSPEAPVPVVLFEREYAMPGGAANVARNVASLGGRPHLFGVVGKDEAGARLKRLLREEGVICTGVRTAQSYQTTEKQRIVISGSHALRLDREVHKVPSASLRVMERDICAALQHADVLVFVDYRKGALTQASVRRIVRHAQMRGIPVLADMKPEHAHFFMGVTLVTPNKTEAFAMTGAVTVRDAGRTLSRRLRSSVLLTESADGMTLFHDSEDVHVPALAQHVVDVSGAGDTVTAAAALALARGGSPTEAMYIANAAAAGVVSLPGTARITASSVRRILQTAPYVS